MKFLISFGERKKIVECMPRELNSVTRAAFNLQNEDLLIEYFDKTFHEYVEIDDFDKLEPESRIRIRINESPSVTKTTTGTASTRKEEKQNNSTDETKEKSEEQPLIDTKKLLYSFLKLALQHQIGAINRKHTGVQCDNCHKEEFTLDRYKCLICEDYDLCGECFERKLSSNSHETSHPMVQFSAPGEIFNEHVENKDINLKKLKDKFQNSTHSTFKCNGCDAESIKGVRFKCYDCNDYDLCCNCYESKIETKNHKINHRLILIGKTLKFTSKDLKFEKKLGEGGFGEVHKARLLPNNKIVACKIIKYNPLMELFGKSIKSLVESYCRECEAYNELNSSYIVKMFGHCYEIEKNETKFYLLMEYMENGSLADVIKNENDSLSLRCRLDMACNIASGLAKIHEKNYIHRDIRPDNILVTANYTAKIADMGIAKLVTDEKNKLQTMVGCIPYMPPEFYTGEYDNKLDIFTFGLTLYELFTGRKHENKNRVISLPEKPLIFSELIENCLDENPKNRLDSMSIQRVLNVFSNVISTAISKVKEYKTLNKEKRDKLFIYFYNSTAKKLRDLGTE